MSLTKSEKEEIMKNTDFFYQVNTLSWLNEILAKINEWKSKL